MKAIHVIAIIAISFIAGMFGGAFSERVFANPKAEVKIHDEVVARAFYLVDKGNKPRAGMAFDPEGNPVLYVKDLSAKTRGYLTCAPKGPMLVLTDQAGGMMSFLEANDDGSSSMGLMKTSGKPRLMMVYKPGQGPLLALCDEDNVAKATMMVTEGKPNVTLTQGDKKPAISIFSDPRKGAMLAAWNSRGQHRLSLGLLQDRPLLFAYNPDDTGLLFNIQRDGRPALGLLTNGRPEWSATGTVPQMPTMDGILDQIMR